MSYNLGDLNYIMEILKEYEKENPSEKLKEIIELFAIKNNSIEKKHLIKWIQELKVWKID
ncbi:MAG: hypothetical protein ACRC4M_04280 [Mycoplasma sp.]